MTTDYVAIPPDLRIGDAIEEVRRLAREAETLEVVFAVGPAIACSGS